MDQHSDLAVVSGQLGVRSIGEASGASEFAHPVRIEEQRSVAICNHPALLQTETDRCRLSKTFKLLQ